MQFNLFADHEFTPLKNLCDSVFKKLHSKGIGASLKTTAVLSADNEKKLWDTNVMNLKTPIAIGLLHAVFFYNGKNFCLRGGAKQCNLTLSQFQREVTIVEGQKVLVAIFVRNLDQKIGKEGLPIYILKTKFCASIKTCLDMVHVMFRFLMPICKASVTS